MTRTAARKPIAHKAARSAAPAVTRRLAPELRREQILDAAFKHFAEVGFDAGTRGLAKRLGVTQPLIYRYFPSKEELVNAVCDRIFLNRWKSEWMDLLCDRTVPLVKRLVDFYCQYTAVMYTPELVRLLVFSGIDRFSGRGWYHHFLESHVLSRICAEIRHTHRLIDEERLPIQAHEIEMLWLLHGGIFFHAMRREVYGAAPRVELRDLIAHAITGLLEGHPRAVGRLLDATAPQSRPKGRTSV